MNKKSASRPAEVSGRTRSRRKSWVDRPEPIVCVALNPAIDRVLSVPRLEVGKVMQAVVAGRYAAGKALNVARVLSALGLPSTVTGFIGQESTDFFNHSLEGTLVRPAFVAVPGATRENITLIQESRPGDTHLRSNSNPVRRREVEELTDLLLELAEEESTFVFSGSLPAGLSLSQFRRMLQAVAAVGAKVVVDTSGPALKTAVEAGAWLIKPNEAELAELVGRKLRNPRHLAEAARTLCTDGREVLLSAGAQGAMLFTPHLACQASCPVDRQRIVSTVGAGDALLAGYLAGFARNLPAPQALRQAVATASAALGRTQCALVRKADINHLLPRVQVREL